MNAAETLEMARLPHAWSEYVTADTSRDRLSAILSHLQEAPADDVLRARAAHVLMLLGRPREANALLLSRMHRLCRAQRLLALVQIARDENNPRLYVDVAAHVPHFGIAMNPLELEAQMRLDYALGLAHAELGSDASRVHFDRALHVSLMIGALHMEAAINGTLPRREARRDPQGSARRLALLAADTHASGNATMAQHLARNARNILAEANAYEEIIQLCEDWGSWLPEAAGWAEAARTLLDPAQPPPPVGDGQDELALVAQAYHHLYAAVRAAERLDDDVARDHAVAVLRLPGWPRRGRRSTPEVAYRALRILAYLCAGQAREAVIALREAAQDNLHLVSDVASVYMGVAGLCLIGQGAAYPAEWTPVQAYGAALSGLGRLDHDLAVLVATRAALVAPSAVAFLARSPDAPSALGTVGTSRVLLLREMCGAPTGGDKKSKGAVLILAGKPVPGSPREQAGQVLRELFEEGTSPSPNARMYAHRYTKALREAGSPPVACTWRMARIEAELQRHLPAAMSPRCTS